MTNEVFWFTDGHFRNLEAMIDDFLKKDGWNPLSISIACHDGRWYAAVTAEDSLMVKGEDDEA